MNSYFTMTDHEINALVQDRFFPPFPDDRCPICGWKLVPDGGAGCRVGNCSMRPGPDRRADAAGNWCASDNAARLVRNRVRELGLVARYRHHLATQIWPEDTPYEQFKGADEFAFLFEQATSRQQCIAALVALDDKRKGAGA